MADRDEVGRASTSRLMALPVEIQLVIYELVVVHDEPLLLNCPCNSSYWNRFTQMTEDEEAWDIGQTHPPAQPALTRTCRDIRELALPLFYSENVFRACYCTPEGRPAMLPQPIKWLRFIGQGNRETLRHLYFYDRNPHQDQFKPWRFEELKDSAIFSEMEGKMETMNTKSCCAHLVKFGNWQRKEGEIPLALQAGAKRLRMPNER